MTSVLHMKPCHHLQQSKRDEHTMSIQHQMKACIQQVHIRTIPEAYMRVAVSPVIVMTSNRIQFCTQNRHFNQDYTPRIQISTCILPTNGLECTCAKYLKQPRNLLTSNRIQPCTQNRVNTSSKSRQGGMSKFRLPVHFFIFLSLYFKAVPCTCICILTNSNLLALIIN
jgi:hypothetical protein